MNRERIVMLVTVDLDPVYGEFNTRESWKRQLQRHLDMELPWYHPEVEVGFPVLSAGALVEFRRRLMGLEGYTDAIADAVVENYPNEIAEANGWLDLFAYKPMSDEAIKEADTPQHV